MTEAKNHHHHHDDDDDADDDGDNGDADVLTADGADTAYTADIARAATKMNNVQVYM